MNLRPSALAAWLSPCVLAAALCTALPAQALYKVVGPDGRVTYTDQPPVSVENKVKSMGVGESGGSGGVTSGSPLPFELQQIVQRFPVVLYTAKDCAPCDEARAYLRQRGIPFNERTVSNARDGAALSRLTGGNTLPSATIGSQLLRGYQNADWASYLDVAGYPATSKLPASFQQAQATPLTERPAAPAAPAQPAPAAAVDAIPPPPSPSGIRF